jgi:hypothetical protein
LQLKYTQTFSTDNLGTNVISFTVKFYQTLAKDAVTGLLNNPATTDANAEFVEVIAQPRQLDFWLAGIVGSTMNTQVRARAVAGLGSAFCQVPPMFICQDGGVPFTSADIGRGVQMKAKGGGGQWFPGNFGWLDLPSGNGAALIKESVASVNPPTVCYDISAQQQTQPGTITSIAAALNVRFDVWAAPFNNPDMGNAQYQPARNTVKGTLKFHGGGQKCGMENKGWEDPADLYIGNGDLTATTMPLPRDECHYVGATGNCPAGRFGNKAWNYNLYMSKHHPIAVAGGTVPNTAGFDAYGTADGIISRWEVYKWELDGHMSELENTVANGKVDGEECYTDTLPSASVTPPNDRRLLCVASIDCTNANSMTGKNDVTIEQWLGIFLTEPMGLYGNNIAFPQKDLESIYGEIVGPNACSGADAIVARQVVQLYE